MVELEVTAKYDVAVGCLDGNAHRVGDRVSNGERLYICIAHFHSLPGLHDFNIKRSKFGELVLTLFYHQGCERPGVDGWVANALHNVWYAPDVIEVTVSYKEGADFLLAGLKILHIW